MKSFREVKREYLEEQARHLFNPYAEELNFTEKDWRVFLARIEVLMKEIYG